MMKWEEVVMVYFEILSQDTGKPHEPTVWIAVSRPGFMTVIS
jgi:hypothetical protein